MKTTTLALCAAAAALVPSVAVVAFVPATPTLSPGGSRSKEATTRIIMAAPANEEGAAGVSRGGFLSTWRCMCGYIGF